MFRQEAFPSLSSLSPSDQPTTSSKKDILGARNNFLTRSKKTATILKDVIPLTFELAQNFAGLVADIVQQKPEDLPRAAIRALIDTGQAHRHQEYLRQHPANLPPR